MSLESETFSGEWEDAQLVTGSGENMSELEANFMEADEASEIERREVETAEANRQRRREHIRRRMLSESNLARTDRLLSKLGYKLPENQPGPDRDRDIPE